MSRHERFQPFLYANEDLMEEFNEMNIALKVWLYPEYFGDSLQQLQRNYPKPTIEEMDSVFVRIIRELKKDAKSGVKF